MIAAIAALGLCAQAAWALPQGLSANWNATTLSDSAITETPTWSAADAGPYASDFSPSEWASIEIPDQTTILTLSSTTITTAVEVDATPIFKPEVGLVELSSACPTYNDTIYTSQGGNLYRIECFRDHYGGDIGLRYVNSLGACVAACDTFPSCVLAVWAPGTPGACYLKRAVNNANENIELWGAVRYPLPGVDYGVSTTAVAATTSSLAVGSAVSMASGFATSSDSYSALISSSSIAATASITVGSAASATGAFATPSVYSSVSDVSAPDAASSYAPRSFSLPAGGYSFASYATQTFTMPPGEYSSVSVGSAPAAAASYATQSIIMPSSVQGLDIASMLADNMSATQSVIVPTASLTPFNTSLETAAVTTAAATSATVIFSAPLVVSYNSSAASGTSAGVGSTTDITSASSGMSLNSSIASITFPAPIGTAPGGYGPRPSGFLGSNGISGRPSRSGKPSRPAGTQVGSSIVISGSVASTTWASSSFQGWNATSGSASASAVLSASSGAMSSPSIFTQGPTAPALHPSAQAGTGCSYCAPQPSVLTFTVTSVVSGHTVYNTVYIQPSSSSFLGWNATSTMSTASAPSALLGSLSSASGIIASSMVSGYPVSMGSSSTSFPGWNTTSTISTGSVSLSALSGALGSASGTTASSVVSGSPAYTGSSPSSFMGWNATYTRTIATALLSATTGTSNTAIPVASGSTAVAVAKSSSSSFLGWNATSTRFAASGSPPIGTQGSTSIVASGNTASYTPYGSMAAARSSSSAFQGWNATATRSTASALPAAVSGTGYPASSAASGMVSTESSSSVFRGWNATVSSSTSTVLLSAASGGMSSPSGNAFIPTGAGRPSRPAQSSGGRPTWSYPGNFNSTRPNRPSGVRPTGWVSRPVESFSATSSLATPAPEVPSRDGTVMMTITQVLTVAVDGAPSLTTVTTFPTESAIDGAVPEDEVSSDDEASSQDDATVATMTRGWTTTQVESASRLTTVTVPSSEDVTDENLSEDATTMQYSSGSGLTTVTIWATQGAAVGTPSQEATATQAGSEPGLTTVTVSISEDVTTSTLSQDLSGTQVAGVSDIATVTVTVPALASPTGTSPSESLPPSRTLTWWPKIFKTLWEKVYESDSTAEPAGSSAYPTYKPSGYNGVFYGNVTRSGSTGASAVYLVPSGYGQAGPSNVATGVASMVTGTTNTGLRPSNTTVTSDNRPSFFKIHLDLAALVKATIENIRISRRTYEVNVELFADLSWRSERSETNATVNQQGNYKTVMHILDGIVIKMFGNNIINYYYQAGDKVYYSKFCNSCPITPVMKEGDSYALPPPCKGCANPVMLAKPGQGDVMQVPNNEQAECGLVEYEPPTCVNCEDMPAAPSDMMAWNSPWSSTTTLSGVVSEPTADQSGKWDGLVAKQICVTKAAYLSNQITEVACLNYMGSTTTQTSAFTASPNQGAMTSQTPMQTGGSDYVTSDVMSNGAGTSGTTSGRSVESSAASTTAMSATSSASAQRTAPVQASQVKAVVRESSGTSVAAGQPRATSVDSKEVTGKPSPAPAQSTEAPIVSNSVAKFAGSGFGVVAGLAAAFFLM